MMRVIHLLFCVLLPIALVVYLEQPAAKQTEGFEQILGHIFGTRYRIVFPHGPNITQVQKAIYHELQHIDAMASTWKSDSELMRYNRTVDKASFSLSPELAYLLDRSQEITQWTNGAFNIRYNPKQIDLSAIAKGYAVDRLCEILRNQFTVTSCLVDIGGEIKVCGPGPRGPHWRVGIYVPGDVNKSVPSPTLSLRDASIATSGTTFKGRHLIDPHTGKSVTNTLLTASVIHPSNTTADALATALFVMGPEQGLSWAKQHHIHALFVLTDGNIIEHCPQNYENRKSN